MTYQTKKTMVSLLASIAILISYCISVYNDISKGLTFENDATFWAKKMLIFIAIGVAINIISFIVFHILLSVNLSVKDSMKDSKEINRKLELEMVEDEMDKLIELKSLHVGYIIASTGFILGLILLAFNTSISIVLNMLFLSFFIGAIAEGLTNLFFYFRGVRNA